MGVVAQVVGGVHIKRRAPSPIGPRRGRGACCSWRLFELDITARPRRLPPCTAAMMIAVVAPLTNSGLASMIR